MVVPSGGLRYALTISHAACRVENRVTLLNLPYKLSAVSIRST